MDALRGRFPLVNTSASTRLLFSLLLLTGVGCATSDPTAPVAGKGGTNGGGGSSGGSKVTGAGGGSTTTGGGGATGSGGAISTGGGGTPGNGGNSGNGGASATGGATGAGGAAGASGAGGAAGVAGNCPGSCSNPPAGSCSAPQVRVTSVTLPSTVSYSTDETLVVPLAIAAMPGGGSRLSWVSSYVRYASSTTSQVNVAQLDCTDKLVGTPFTFPGHDFQDLAADANGGVVVLTRDGAGGPDAQHCGDVNNLCVLPSDRPGCYDMYMVRYDCAGTEQWATKLTTATATTPGYTSGGGDNLFVWWYQHHGRIAYDGTNYAAYFADAITVTNNQCAAGAGKVDIHEGDRMQVVGPTGSLVTGHDSFGIGCSHSWTTRMVWDPRTNHFVMVCATDNNCRIAQPNPYRTVAAGTCDGTLFGGDIVNAGTTGYWTAWSQGHVIRLEHFTTGASDQTVTTAGTTMNPHLVSYGTGRMLLTWGSGTGLAAQVYDSSTGAPVGAQFTIAVPDHPWQSWKAFPDGSVAYAGVASASSTVTVARVMPCTN
jgi:hypothetical protein